MNLERILDYTEILFSKYHVIIINMDGSCGIEDYGKAPYEVEITFETVEIMESWLIEEKRKSGK